MARQNNHTAGQANSQARALRLWHLVGKSEHDYMLEKINKINCLKVNGYSPVWNQNNSQEI